MHFPVIKDLIGRIALVTLLVGTLIFATRDYIPGGGVTKEIDSAENFFHNALASSDAPATPKPIKLTREAKARRLAVAIVAKFTKVPMPRALQYAKFAVNEGDRQNIDPALILAVCAIESSFNPEANNNGVDKGLMQVNIFWQKDLVKEVGGVKALFDPKKNIYAGTKVIAGYMQQVSGDIWLTLRMYNGKHKDNDYPDKVLAEMYSFHKALTVAT